MTQPVEFPLKGCLRGLTLRREPVAHQGTCESASVILHGSPGLNGFNCAALTEPQRNVTVNFVTSQADDTGNGIKESAFSTQHFQTDALLYQVVRLTVYVA